MRLKVSKKAANRGGDIFVWPLAQRVLKLDLKFKMISDDIFFVCNCKISIEVRVFLSRPSNSSIKVKYKGYSVVYYYPTP
jgi:hypothetical protein